MVTKPRRILLNYREYAALPNDGRRYQILDGVLEVAPASATAHQFTVVMLRHILVGYVLRHGLGLILTSPVDVLLSAHSIVQPDIVFIAEARLEEILFPENIRGAPDLMVEVLSPSTARIDRRTKLDLYARHGVAHYWLLDPVRHTATAHELNGTVYRAGPTLRGDDTLRAEPFSELSISLAEIWMPRLPRRAR